MHRSILKLINKRYLLALLLSGAIITTASVLWYRQQQPLPDPTTAVLSGIRACHKQPKQTSCLKTTAQELINKYPIPTILSVINEHEQESDIHQLCHSTLHFVGQLSFRHFPTINEAFQTGGAVCFSGYYHGVMEGYLEEQTQGDLSQSTLKQEVMTICDLRTQAASPKEYNECLHGLGHALMFITDYNLEQSLNSCNYRSKASDAQWCYSGVFMENATSSTNPDHPSKNLRKDDLLYPCNTLESKYLPSCYSLQGHYFAQVSGYDWNATAQLCDSIPKQFQASCYNAIGQVLVGSNKDGSYMATVCQNFATDEQKRACLGGVIGATHERYIESTQRMAHICTAVSSEYKTFCYDNLIGRLQYTGAPPSELRATCTTLLEAGVRSYCLKRIGE